MSFQAPYPPYDPTDKKGFSYDTVVTRWPIIITSIIDEVHNVCHFLVLESQSLEDEAKKASIGERIKEGNEIVAKISKLKYEMARDRALELIHDEEPHADVYNEELKKLEEDKRNTWFTAPWLYAECYLYRLLRSYFVATTQWKDYDPFRLSKLKMFKGSKASILKIATTMHELEKTRLELEADPSKREALFNEMVQMCLWGNATDLSLLTHMTEEDIRNLQTVEKEAQAARSKFILKDDQQKVWNHLEAQNGARVDFVLDNSGFELFTDLVFADFLVTYTPHVDTVVFHPKLIPWFVSDVLPPDFTETLTLLADGPTTFTSPSPTPSSTPFDTSTEESFAHLASLVQRWQKYIDDGVFKLPVPLDTPLGGGGEKGRKAEFWTTPYPYWDMEKLDGELVKDLKESGLVIFKGDLNYRKLTGDIKWPAWTPFNEALGPLAGAFPLLSLRTNKADVAVGVPKEVAERLDAAEEPWRVNGRYALISFVPASA
ncbi:DUF89-domain-containing protein [Coprinellus micaceus]|uniref:Sugar phosphate phosphatase n=1 Tax=Coprinellus micaceus TaxID=71717 RepID=A0A4Y7T7I7_COPMI|nr:DUF89-domain-containing protein [Coprinellus micaceus]